MKSIKPNDLGVNRIVEWSQKININDYVRQANKELKKHLLQSTLDINEVNIGLTYSKTRFGGSRAWFICPVCQKRVGVLFHLNNQILCRICGGLKYKKQRYSKMFENKI